MNFVLVAKDKQFNGCCNWPQKLLNCLGGNKKRVERKACGCCVPALYCQSTKFDSR